MYYQYLFISTNLKARTVRFLDPTTWQWLKNVDFREIYEWLKNSPYSFLSEREDWDLVFWEEISKDLRDIRRSVRDEILESLLLWDFYFHNLKVLIRTLNREKNDFMFPSEFPRIFLKETKDIFNKALEIWERTNSVSDLFLFIDINNIIKTGEFLRKLNNKNITNFYEFRNRLLVIKILYSAKLLSKSWEDLKEMGISQIKSIDSEKLYKTPLDQWVNVYSGTLGEFIEKVIEKEDVDFLIRKYLLGFIHDKFSKVVSGPEIVFFYFYNKYLEGEELITLLRLKRNKIPLEVWEKRLWKINV